MKSSQSVLSLAALDNIYFESPCKAMKNKVFFVILIVLFSSTFLHAEEYKLSMLPRYFPEKLNQMMTPLTEYLSNETGARIDLVLTKDFATYESELLKGKIAIGYENPLVYAKIANKHKAIAIAVKGIGGDQFRGIIITRPDSGISKIAHLKGKKIMIVSESSAGGFLSQALSLEKSGLDAYRDCKIVEAAENRQENVIISVSIGDVDAGFIRESALHIADEYIIPHSIKMIAETAWLPNWALSVSRDLPEDLQNAIQRAVLKLPRDSVVLKAIGLTAFVAASDGDYDVMKEFVDQ